MTTIVRNSPTPSGNPDKRRSTAPKRSSPRTHPDLEIATSLVESDARTALVEASTGASLTVVGSRGSGRLVEIQLGSVAMHVAAHARSPVAVVPHGLPFPDRPVLVGVDGSPAGHAALGHALDQAATRGVDLVAIRACGDLSLRRSAAPPSSGRRQPSGTRSPRRAAGRLARKVPGRARSGGDLPRATRGSVAALWAAMAGRAITPAHRRRQQGSGPVRRWAAWVDERCAHRARHLPHHRCPRARRFLACDEVVRRHSVQRSCLAAFADTI